MLGALVGIVASLCIGSVFMAILSGVRLPRSPSYGGRAEVVQIAGLVAKPVHSAGTGRPRMGEAALLARIDEQLARADAVAQGGGTLAPIAMEYASAIRDGRRAAENVPSAEPLMRAGVETWTADREGDQSAFLSGLVDVGTELAVVSEWSERLRSAHSRIVACRLRLAEAAKQHAAPQCPGVSVSISFQESGVDVGVAADTLVLGLQGGRQLTNALVIIDLFGMNGDTLSNCYFVPVWQSGEVKEANLASAPRWARETVTHVQRIRCLVLADECTVTVEDWTRALP